ncbi:MAG: hypothetical protein J5I92_01380 [Thiogranum sp.]|nr:hypothetical protein [Thiogranum sp.]
MSDRLWTFRSGARRALLCFVLLSLCAAGRAQSQQDSIGIAAETDSQQGTAAVAAGSTPPQQAATGAEGKGAAAVPEPTASGAREDLTVFFSIGIVINLLVLTLFVVWAIGQWRRSRK